MKRENVAILGATGSIGASTLDVLARHPDRYCIYALTANGSLEAMRALCLRHQPRLAVMRDERVAANLADDLAAAGLDTEVLAGERGLIAVAAHPAVDTVMAAIVGAAGLESAMAAAEAGKKLLLANKESLVMAGHLLMAAVRRGGGSLLPIDSEHNARFQCLPGGYRVGDKPAGLRRILLTASGGPFLDRDMASLAEVTPEEAVAHPNWSMGRKISVDSATLMNKGLEFIEACWLFDVGPDQVEVVIHPGSIVHSLVEYRDGSVLAQLGCPDMRTPIASALAWPARIEAGVGSLDLAALGSLRFQAPDLRRFPCLGLAIDAAREGDGAAVVLNAANEVAVAAFLDGSLRFDRIGDLIGRTLHEVPRLEPESLAAVKELDHQARSHASGLLNRV